MGFWKIKAQPSALVTAWRVLEDKISTRENLVRRGIRKDSCICFLCGEEEETTSHLFSLCRVVPDLCGLTALSGWDGFNGS